MNQPADENRPTQPPVDPASEFVAASEDVSPAIPPAPDSRRILLGGCAAVLTAVGLFVAAAWMILSALQPAEGGDAGADDAPYVAPGERAMQDRGILTRSEARALRADLRKLERELEFAESQREVDFDLASREGWSQRIAELEEQRDAILERLRR